MLCLYCKTEFKAARASAKYCSSKCRVYARREAQPNVTLTESPVTLREETPVTDTKEPESPNSSQSPDETLFNLMEEYERLYLNTKCPSYMPAKSWKKLREDRLAELKRQIAEYDNKL